MNHVSFATTSQPSSDQFIKAIDRMLLAIVRLCLGRISFDVLVERLRHVMVQEGSRRIAQETGGKVIKSRVALLTGVRTDHIGRDLKNNDIPIPRLDDLTVEARILTAWSKDPAYKNPDTGQPKDLHIYGNGDTFQRLVAVQAGRGVTAQTVLDSLLKAGNVEIVNEHWIRLVNPCWYHLSADEVHILNHTSFAVANLINTVDWNMKHLEQAELKRLQRMVWSVSLPEERIPELRYRLNTLLNEFVEASRKEIRRQEDQEQTEYNRILVGTGMYYWEYDSEDDDFVPMTHLPRGNVVFGKAVHLDQD